MGAVVCDCVGPPAHLGAEKLSLLPAQHRRQRTVGLLDDFEDVRGGHIGLSEDLQQIDVVGGFNRRLPVFQKLQPDAKLGLGLQNLNGSAAVAIEPHSGHTARVHADGRHGTPVRDQNRRVDGLLTGIQHRLVHVVGHLGGR